MPKANRDAKMTRDIYSLSLFFTEPEVASFKSEAFDYLNDTEKELLKKGSSRDVSSCYLMISRFPLNFSL